MSATRDFPLPRAIGLTRVSGAAAFVPHIARFAHHLDRVSLQEGRVPGDGRPMVHVDIPYMALCQKKIVKNYIFAFEQNQICNRSKSENRK